MFAEADHSASPPRVSIPRVYNAAVDLVERNLARGRAERVAFIDDAGRYSYRELAQRVNRCANAWRRLGLRSEDRVVLLLHDSIDFPTAFLGAIRAGVVPIPCNTLLTAADYEYLLADSRARAVVVSAPLAPAIAPLAARLDSLDHVIVSGAAVDGTVDFSAWIAPEADDAPVAVTTADDVCFWLYSSGSTGSPKGAVHLHSDLIQTAELYARPVLGIAPDDVVFSAAKLFFAYGLGNALTFPLAVGATSVLMAERPTPAAVFKRLVAERPTIFYGVPTLYAAMLASAEFPAREQLGLRRCVSAGEALPADLGKRWRDKTGVDILDGLGSTEMLHIFLSNHPDDVCYGTTGRPVPGYELRVVLLEQSRQESGNVSRALDPQRRQVHRRRRWPLCLLRAHRRHAQGRRRVRVAIRGRGGAGNAQRRARSGGGRLCGRERADQAEGLCGAQAGARTGTRAGRGAAGPCQGAARAVQISALDRIRRRPAEDRDRQDPAFQAAGPAQNMTERQSAATIATTTRSILSEGKP